MELLSHYWPHILAVFSFTVGAAAAIHVAMTKEEVRSAIGWVGVIMLSPVVGAVLYMIAGVNRIRRSNVGQQWMRVLVGPPEHIARYDVTEEQITACYGRRFTSLMVLGNNITPHQLTTGNDVRMLERGDEAYEAMCAAIEAAERSIILESYIFDRDRVGQHLADCLIAAHARGVEVRVLVDAVGARYSFPSILSRFRKAGVPVDVFNGNVIVGLRLPYANLRTHRKILVVDGTVAFTGGMNIREGFSHALLGDKAALDTHFQVRGRVVADLFFIAAADWRFASGETLDGEAWRIADPDTPPGGPVIIRAVPSGPDRSVETNAKLLMGAFSVARSSIRIMSPYFLPDRELISALATAARRGVQVDIVVPGVNNLTLVDKAMTAQFDQFLKNYCRIWRSSGPFNHSKLLTIDGRWSYTGSSNLDGRSLRLNFEIDLEVYDSAFAAQVERRIDAAIAEARPVTLEALRNRPFPVRLMERILWLGSPYL
ncbi:phospholipase D-like domain-containing protein [Rhizobiaceae bacterium BDR2-2]|uniref:Phospholipase D n=1 Tax=Ectorhizobium quercum TaxID=2965071 RepID=A0AAE3MZB4_9HYPH|nr:phospholipase D-like domain-containing protein [Ectorhizobium quercum]MCX8996450.1 phospholipase D-like domain-containing protein [Ectorhizobium quercum]